MMFGTLLSYVFLITTTLSNNTNQTPNNAKKFYISCVKEEKIPTHIKVYVDHPLNFSFLAQGYELKPINLNNTTHLRMNHITTKKDANITFHTPGKYLCLYLPSHVIDPQWSLSYISSLPLSHIPPKKNEKKEPEDQYTILIITIGLVAGTMLHLLYATCNSRQYREDIDKIKRALQGTEYEKKYQKKYLYDPIARSFGLIFCEIIKDPCGSDPKKPTIAIEPISYRGYDPTKYDLKLTIPYPKDAQKKILQSVGYDVHFPQQKGLFSQEEYWLRIKDFTPPKNHRSVYHDTRTTPLIISVQGDLNTQIQISPTPVSCCCCFKKNTIKPSKKELKRHWRAYNLAQRRPRCILPLPENLSSEQQKKLHEALAFDGKFYNQFIGAVDVIIQDEPEKETVEYISPYTIYSLSSPL